MRGVVPGDLLDGDVMLPDLKFPSPTRSGLQFRLLRLEANDIKGVFLVIVIVVFVTVVFDVTHVRTRENNGIGAFLHQEQSAHTIWMEIQATVIPSRATVRVRNRVSYLDGERGSDN